jgi:hypothetical protein
LNKTAIQKDLKRMADHYTFGSNLVATTLTLTSETEAAMEKVVEYGAQESSEVYYIATKLFGKQEN